MEWKMWSRSLLQDQKKKIIKKNWLASYSNWQCWYYNFEFLQWIFNDLWYVWCDGVRRRWWDYFSDISQLEAVAQLNWIYPNRGSGYKFNDLIWLNAVLVIFVFVLGCNEDGLGQCVNTSIVSRFQLECYAMGQHMCFLPILQRHCSSTMVFLRTDEVVASHTRFWTTGCELGWSCMRGCNYDNFGTVVKVPYVSFWSWFTLSSTDPLKGVVLSPFGDEQQVDLF